MSYSEVGKVYDEVLFKERLKGVDLSWAKGVTIHHTWKPSLEQRPKGLLMKHIRNIRDYYENTLGWSSGPHLFIDEDQIYGMSPLHERSVHALSFNATHISLEALGNYDVESPYQGRGLEVWNMMAIAAATLLTEMGLPASRRTINFHRDDPKTSKTCPGSRIDKALFIKSVRVAMEAAGESKPTSTNPIARFFNSLIGFFSR